MEILEADRLGKRYGRRWALAECTLTIPAGRVVGLVGPNGAGKTTLLHLAAGVLTATSGAIRVLGARPAAGPAQLGRVGFVAQHTPAYPALSVADHLRMGGRLNPRWDAALAEQRIARLGLDPRQRAGRLSGGQRAGLALTLAIAKRPELLILDEPVAGLDPPARRDFMRDLARAAAEQEISILLSSHLISDLEQVCDHLVVLAASRVQVSGEIERLLASHRRLVGSWQALVKPPSGCEVIAAQHSDGQNTLLVRAARPDVPVSDPAWRVEPAGLEELALAYMDRAEGAEP